MKNNITYYKSDFILDEILPWWKFLYDNQKDKHIYSEINTNKQIIFFI